MTNVSSTMIKAVVALVVAAAMVGTCFHSNNSKTLSLIRGAHTQEEEARNLQLNVFDVNRFVPPPVGFPSISVQLPSIFPIPNSGSPFPPLVVPKIPTILPPPGNPSKNTNTFVVTPTLSVELPLIFPAQAPTSPFPALRAPPIPKAPAPPGLGGGAGVGTLIVIP